MRKFKLMALAMGLAFTALQADVEAAPNRCELQCYEDYEHCQVVCSKNPCFVSCETVLEICLSNCGIGPM